MMNLIRLPVFSWGKKKGADPILLNEGFPAAQYGKWQSKDRKQYLWGLRRVGKVCERALSKGAVESKTGSKRKENRLYVLEKKRIATYCEVSRSILLWIDVVVIATRCPLTSSPPSVTQLFFARQRPRSPTPNAPGCETPSKGTSPFRVQGTGGCQLLFVSRTCLRCVCAWQAAHKASCRNAICSIFLPRLRCMLAWSPHSLLPHPAFSHQNRQALG